MAFTIFNAQVNELNYTNVNGLPLAYFGMYQLIQWMNPEESRTEAVVTNKNMDCLETLEKKVIGLLTFSGLVVAALVESVVRIAFSLVAFLPAAALSCCSGEPLKFVVVLGVGGLGALIDSPFRFLSFLVQKVFLDCKNIDNGARKGFEDLTICTCS